MVLDCKMVPTSAAGGSIAGWGGPGLDHDVRAALPLDRPCGHAAGEGLEPPGRPGRCAGPRGVEGPQQRPDDAEPAPSPTGGTLRGSGSGCLHGALDEGSGQRRAAIKTVLVNAYVAGHVLCFEQFGQPQVSYWIGKTYRGKGVATEPFSQFLAHIQVLPSYALGGKDNIASIRVLQKM